MPVHNEDVAAIFDEIADLLEIEEANPFRVRAYRNAARTVRGLGRELQELVHAGKDLTKLQGIGKDLAAKIEEILATGTAKALKELHREVPASLEELLKIPGLGPKRVKALYKDLNIKTVAQLERAARKGQLRELPGFGAKTEARVLELIDARREKKKRFLRAVAAQYGEPLAEYLGDTPGVKEVVLAGSYRRGRDTVGDLDILLSAARKCAVLQRFVDYDEVAEVISHGTTRAAVILKCGLQVDVRRVPAESFGAALHYFTGSKAHNIQVRRLGQQRGLKINEYGVFKGEQRVAGKTELSVFKSVGLPYIAPELREGQGEVEAAAKGRLPKLVERGDLKGDLHVHTDATDGHASLRAMAEAARARGLTYIAVTDHSKHLRVANGLDERRLRQQVKAIDKLNTELKGIRILKGIEVDILEDGTLDLSDEVLAELDVVIGAVHDHFHLPRGKQTERILRAMDHRFFSILAHPSGRLLEERESYDVDMERVIRHAAERGCFLELNAQPKRLDLIDTQCRMAHEAGVAVCINSDAHGEDDFDYLALGVAQARRGWLQKSDVLNTRPLTSLRNLLSASMA